MLRFGTGEEKSSGARRLFAVSEVFGDSSLDIAVFLDAHGQRIEPDMLTLIKAGESIWNLLKEIGGAEELPEDAMISNSDIRWLAPIPRPPKVVCTFANNPDIELVPLEKSQPEWPRPLFFLKAPTSIIGLDDPIVIPPGIGLVQPEAEFSVVIGETAKNLTPETAENAIFGYTMLNDITAAGLSWQDAVTLGIPEDEDRERFVMRPMARYKGMDTFGPLGPYIAPKWELESPETVSISLLLNDEPIQHGTVGELRWRITEILCAITRWITLEPGDIVSLGTIRQVAGRPLRTDISGEGNVVKVKADGIGELRNPVRMEKRPS